MTTSAPATARLRHRGAGLRLGAPEALFAALLLLGAAIVLYQTRGMSFYFDDWDFILHRRGLSADVLLSPHGPHLSAIPILAYKVLLQTFGGTSYLPFRILSALDLTAMALVLGIVCREWWGRWWGLAPVVLLVTLGTGAIDLLWSFQVGYAIADAAGFVALIALSRGGRHSNLIACLALILALASASQGICFLAGAAVIVVARGGRRRSAWVVLVPGILYGLWYLKYGAQNSETYLVLWRTSLPYVMTAFSSTVAGVLGLGSPSSDLPPQLDPSFGQPLVWAAIIALAAALWRGWRPPPMFWGALSALLALWLAASLSNIAMNRRPTDSRYLPTVLMLLAVCVCVALPRPRLRTAGTAAVIAALGIVAATNAGQFRGMRYQMLASDIASRAQLGALLILRGVVPPQFTPAPPWLPGLINDVQAGPFYSAVDAFGTIADSPAELLQANEPTRQLADQVLERGELIGLSFTQAAAAQSSAPPKVLLGRVSATGSCVRLLTSSTVVDAPPGTLKVTAPPRTSLSLAIGRFARAFDIALGTIPGGHSATIHIPSDRLPQLPWQMLISGGGGTVCA